MKVVTLHQETFRQACGRLAEIVNEDYMPDVVVGILTGGGYVAKFVKEALRKNDDICYAEVETHRAGHKTKNSRFAKKLYSLMPMALLDFLRIVESRFLQWKGHFGKPKQRIVSICDSEELNNRLSEKGSRILIVDDAVDSGSTMASVINLLNQEFPGNIIRTAAITVTTSTSLVEVDYALYREGVLVRFPWSNDMKQ